MALHSAKLLRHNRHTRQLKTAGQAVFLTLGPSVAVLWNDTLSVYESSDLGTVVVFSHTDSIAGFRGWIDFSRLEPTPLFCVLEAITLCLIARDNTIPEHMPRPSHRRRADLKLHEQPK